MQHQGHQRPLSGLHLKAGHHLLNGWQALGYVRARYTLGNGSDIERIGRQQAFMSSLVERVKSELLHPLAITGSSTRPPGRSRSTASWVASRASTTWR